MSVQTVPCVNAETAESGGGRGLFIEELVKSPINFLYRAYQSAMAASPPPEDDNGTPQPQQQQRRMHPRAENCGSSLRAGTASLVLSSRDGGALGLADLPVSVLLHVASYLDAVSLCRLQQTSRHMHAIMSDELLWRQKLQADSSHWPVLGHLSHPKVYQDASSDLSAQEIYESCYVNRSSASSLYGQSFSHPFTQRLRSLMRRLQGHVPRLLMFGSGLESVPLIRLMIMDTNSPYKPVGLFPGKDGIGSGVCIKHKNTTINLVTLYTATRAERVSARQGQTRRVNKLISAYSEGDSSAPELTGAVQEQCQIADGFILSVDATNLTEDALTMDLMMLKAMLRSCANDKTALLVLACHMPNDSHDAPLPSLDIADRLKLLDISHPWQVRTLNINTFDGLAAGFDWLLAATNS